MNRLATLPLALLALSLFASPAAAAIKTQTVEYKEGDTQLAGYLAYDDAIKGDRPAVIVVHEWYGLNDYAKKRAEQLAGLGYVAFAADIYGKGVTAKSREEAAQMAGKYKGDRALLRARVNAALELVRTKIENVDKTKIAAMGYCFGGTTALELARGGADVVGVISFHGGLGTPMPAEAGKLKAKVLALHGADDPFVPDDELLAFRKEMQAAKADWELVAYGNSVHGFTNPGNGSDNSKGAAYNAEADRKSWERMKAFFDEVFGTQKKS
jgi:dienelactone hydrolase